MLPIVGMLLEKGLSLLGNAVLAKGQDVIEKELGVKLSQDMSDADIMKLKQYELEHEEELLKLQLEENKLDLEAYKVHVQDLGNARDSDVKIQESANASWMSKNVKHIIAPITIILCFVGYGYIFEANLDQNKKEIAMLLLGYLTSYATQIYSYYFGDSDKVKVQGGVK